MIDFPLISIAPTPNVLKAYLYQIINSFFGFSQDLIEDIVRLKAELNVNDVNTWHLNTFSDEELETILSTHDLIPSRFFYFLQQGEMMNIAQQQITLVHEETDYRDYPELFTDIHQVSFDKNGLIVMELFNQQVYKLFNHMGEELISYCSDLLLGVGGGVLCRFSDNVMWQLVSYNGHILEWNTSEMFGPIDDPADFPDLKDRDQIPQMSNFDENYLLIARENQTIEHDRLLELLAENKQNYRYLSAHYANDLALAEEAVKKNKLAFTLLSNELQHHEEFIDRLLSNTLIDKKLYNYLPLEFKQNESFVLKCIESNPDIIKKLQPIHSKDVLLNAIEMDSGRVLQYASTELKADEDCIKMAMRKNWHTIRYMSVELLKNEEFFTSLLNWYNTEVLSSMENNPLTKLEAVKYLSRYANPMVISHLAPVNDLDLIMTAASGLTQNDFPEFLSFCDNSVKETSSFWLSLLKVNSHTMHFIPPNLLQNYDFMLNATKINGEVIYLFSDDFRNNEELVFHSIQQIIQRRGIYNLENILTYISIELMRDINFIKRVFKIWHSITEYMDESLRNNEELFLYGIQEFSPRIFSNACDTLQNNLKFILKALKLDENVFDYLSDSMKSNETIQQNINSVKLQKYLNEINSGNNPNSMDDDLPF